MGRVKPMRAFRSVHRSLVLVVTVIATLSLSPRLVAQRVSAPQVSEIESLSRQQLRRIDGNLKEERWADAAGQLYSLGRRSTRDAGRFVIQPSHAAEFRYAVPLHRHVQDLVGRLPERSRTQILAELRRRGDAQAAKLLQEGTHSDAIASLRRIVDTQLYASRGDDALMRLGDAELAKENYAMARGYWRRIAGELTGYSGDVNLAAPFVPYPDTDLPLADIRARLVMASILERRFTEAETELALLKQDHLSARGRLGGVEVDLAETLENMLAVERAKTEQKDGTNLRGQDRDTLANPSWRVPLMPSQSDEIFQSESRPVFRPRVLPAVSGGTVFFADGDSLFARDVRTGRPVPWANDSLGTIYSSETSDRLDSRNLPFAISIDRDRVFAVLPQEPSDLETATTVRSVVGINFMDQGRVEMDSRLPRDRTRLSEGLVESIAGPVVSHGARRFVAFRDSAARPETSVVCFNESGRIWTTSICRSEAYRDTRHPRVSLAYAEGHVFVVTNGGAVAALDADTGRVRWMTIYQRAELTPEPINLLARPWFRYRDRSQPVVHRGLLVIAPADYSGLIALDTFSGRLVWRTEFPVDTFDATEVVCVTDRFVVANGRRLWWIDRATGELSSRRRQDNPVPRELQADLRSSGMATVQNERIYWPARDDQADWIYVFDAATGEMPQQPIRLTDSNVEAGNLVAKSGMLVIAGEREIVAYPLEIGRTSRREPVSEVE